MMRRLVAIALLCAASAASAQDKKPPYWASIASGEAMMRTGPGRNYPGVWLYKRRDLPVRVLQIYPNWRKIEDPDGEKGWMLVTLLSDRRTAMKPTSARAPATLTPRTMTSTRSLPVARSSRAARSSPRRSWSRSVAGGSPGRAGATRRLPSSAGAAAADPAERTAKAVAATSATARYGRNGPTPLITPSASDGRPPGDGLSIGNGPFTRFPADGWLRSVHSSPRSTTS